MQTPGLPRGQVVLQQNKGRLVVPRRKALRRFNGVFTSVRHIAPVPLNLRHRAEQRAVRVLLSLLSFMQRVYAQTSPSNIGIREYVTVVWFFRGAIKETPRTALKADNQDESLSRFRLVWLTTKG
jgi:hypothetical protein